MLPDPSTLIKDADFNFENTPVKITARRSSPEIKLAGLQVGPLEEEKEYEIMYWIACELERAGSDFEHVIDSIQLYEENTRFNKYIRQAEMNKELPRFATTVESFERGQAIFRDICQRSGSEALKYASDLLHYWGRAGLRYIGRHSP